MKELIEPYNPEWKTGFNNLKLALEQELKGFDCSIQHVGSTAIPGLCAKPILDMDIIISNKTLLNDISRSLESLGYISKGEQGIAGRFAFRQSSVLTPLTANPKKWQAHHLYVCFDDSTALKNHLVFRDALLHNQELVTKYAQLKKELSEEPGMTRETYTVRKTDFIMAAFQSLGLKATELQEINKANK